MAFKKRAVTQEEFFAINAKNCSRETLAEKVYLQVHTAYLTPGTKVKPLLGILWKTEFGLYMEDESFEYLRGNDPVLIIDIIVEETRKGAEITLNKYLLKAVVALEFDLWMIENYRAKRELQFSAFAQFMEKKYGKGLDGNVRSYHQDNLAYLENYEKLAKELDAYYEGILAFLGQLLNNNRMRISIDHLEVNRIVEERKEENLPLAQPDQQKEQPIIQKSGNTFEYEILIKDLQERIEKLEKDIKEFKRQRDDAREYSANQYDKGIKDLFMQMNDVRYGKVIDYFYRLMGKEGIEENLAAYLENFFMILEDMEIEPIAGREAGIEEKNLTRDYNLEFDKKEYAEGNAEVKFVGWKYKDMPMEKPTLKLKER